jgi:transketolase
MAATKIATREAYGLALAECGADPNVVVLDADLSKSTKTDTFKKKYPERFVNCGIAEGNMMAVAAGIASTGKTVFASTFAVFAALRACEQVRNSICYPKLNVKVCATHAGISIGEDGASHQAIEDIAVMRAIPNMTVVSTCDGVSTAAAVRAIVKMDGPVYLRLGRLAVDPVYDDADPAFRFELGKGITLRDGKDVTIVATGLMVQIAKDAAEKLAAEGVSARLIDIHTIKPIDRDLLVKAARETGAIVTCEEHNVMGGLGSAVAEVLAETLPTPMRFLGIEDKFGKSGKPAALLAMYGLTAEKIVAKAKEAMAAKAR